LIDSEYCYEDDAPNLFPQARGILYALKDSGINVAIASRTPTPEIAKTFLDKLGIQSIFVAQVSLQGSIVTISFQFPIFLYLLYPRVHMLFDERQIRRWLHWFIPASFLPL